MGQFTFLIDEDLRRAAKIYAAERGTTLSDLIRDLLTSKIGWKVIMSAEPDDATLRAVLAAYGDGLIERSDALQRLGRDPSEVLWLRERMNELGVAWPQQAREAAESQSDGFVELLTEEGQ
ncbi:hypothetical protein [Aureimonas sp. AU22]|uniref:hypothetical protein n=1 Tax=Aureimonas sp. AU22 TaxID=1638162 RepID=UPI000783CF2A|nr:hypothetical protein [Aureimonas sp. AU22]